MKPMTFSPRTMAQCAAWLSLLVAGAANANLIANGSFETSGPGVDGGLGRPVYIVGTNGDGITDWTLEGSGDVYLHVSPDIGFALGPAFVAAQSGSQYLDLSGGLGGGASGVHATVAQTFATVPSATYELSFYIGAANSPSASINVSLTGASSLLNETLSAVAPVTNIVWTKQSFTFVADSALTTLRFHDTSPFDDNYSFVDNVSVTAVPEPGAWALILAGLATMPILVRRRT